MQRLIIIYIFLIVSCQNKQKKIEVINAQDFWDIVCAIHEQYPFIQDTIVCKIVFIGIRKNGNVKDLEMIKEMGSNIACFDSDFMFLSLFPELH